MSSWLLPVPITRMVTMASCCFSRRSNEIRRPRVRGRAIKKEVNRFSQTDSWMDPPRYRSVMKWIRSPQGLAMATHPSGAPSISKINRAMSSHPRGPGSRTRR